MTDVMLRRNFGYPVPRFLIGDAPPDEMFAFRVPDDTLAPRHICEGDILIMAKRSYARRGEVAIVRGSDGRMLLGLYYHLGLQTEIRPADPEFEPAVFPADAITVQGVMRGLMRSDAH